MIQRRALPLQHRAEAERATLEQTGWMLKARCYDPQVDPEIFFAADPPSDSEYAILHAKPRLTPRDNSSLPAHQDREERIRNAKEICMSCPVRDICLQYALSRGEKFGIYGGWTPRERVQFLRSHQDRLVV